jgi:Fe-S-cluster containining protein
MAETSETAQNADESIDQRDPKAIARILHVATSLPDRQAFTEMDRALYTTVDYYRMACHLIFKCHRCGTCCTTGDPIRLKIEDATAIARHLKIPLNKAIKKLTIPDPNRPGVLDFKHILPCKFYDKKAGGCKIYVARPWSCRIFPFLGVYGSEDHVVVNESCPGSVETMKKLTEALEDVRSDQKNAGPHEPAEVKRAKEFLRQALSQV